MPSDIEIVTSFYSAMAARDFGAMFALLDESFVVTQDERLPWGGRWEGHDGFAAFGLALSGAIDSSVTMLGLFSADGDVVQMGRTAGTVRATGVAFDIPEVHRWTIGPDGRAVRAHFSIDTPAMLTALSGSA